MNWSSPLRPIQHAEQTLVSAILNGTFPPGSTLPGERELAAQLGVTRPTLREVQSRLANDGWLTIQQGKPTRVNDYWRQGGLNVLAALVRYSQELPTDFVPNLLAVRLALAPAYTRAAVEHAPLQAVDCLAPGAHLADEAGAFATFDWQVHHTLTIASGNPLYTLILNGFADFYVAMAQRYFEHPQSRSASRGFYVALATAAAAQDGQAAEEITRAAMQASMALWANENNK